MKNEKDNSYLKNGSKKDKEIKKYKRSNRRLYILLGIVTIFALLQVGQNMFQEMNGDEDENVNYIFNETNGNETIQICKEPTLINNIVKFTTSFMTNLFEYPGSFWTKFFIFLGIVYLIQVVFSLAFDVIELILLVFVVIKRLILWIYKKITGRDKRDEQLKKITELYSK